MSSPNLRRTFLISSLLIATTLPSLESAAEPPAAALYEQLRSKRVGVRVAAALRLGSHRHPATRLALEAALSDPVAKVRAAAAAALQRLGDRSSLPHLLPLLEDESPAVRRQVQVAVAALKAEPETEHVDVEVGRVRRVRGVGDAALSPLIVATAKSTLRRLPGVRVTVREAPGLLLEGQLLSLDGQARKHAYTVSARVEFVITRMPHRLIHGRASGAATAYGEVDAHKRPESLRRLEREAVQAATQSALADASAAFRPAD